MKRAALEIVKLAKGIDMQTHVKVIGLLAFLATAPAVADCRIYNETRYSFEVDSGDAYRQSLGPHQESQFARGQMTASGEDDAGHTATFGGFCGDGDRYVVRVVRGSRGEWIPVLLRR